MFTVEFTHAFSFELGRKKDRDAELVSEAEESISEPTIPIGFQPNPEE